MAENPASLREVGIFPINFGVLSLFLRNRILNLAELSASSANLTSLNFFENLILVQDER